MKLRFLYKAHMEMFDGILLEFVQKYFSLAKPSAVIFTGLNPGLGQIVTVGNSKLSTWYDLVLIVVLPSIKLLVASNKKYLQKKSISPR